MIKRLLDIAIAGTALFIAAPIIVMIAIAIKFTMGGPVIFGHQRVGRHGRNFYCLKFRSMARNGDEVLHQFLDANPAAQLEWSQKQKLANDPRITRFGRILRRSSLDELPQFYNILRGDMSCVGPRPIVEGELTRYGEYAIDYTSVRPGLTGIWQVSGRSRLSYETRVQLDVDYIRNWTLGYDLSIMLRTIPAVMKPDDAG
jgi:exopolysaccharide production protein ExoY